MSYPEGYERAATLRYMSNELKQTDPAGPVVLHADAVGVGAKTKWRCRLAGVVEEGDVILADAKGAERVFSDIGRMLAEVAKDLQIVGGEYEIRVHAGTALDKAMPADLIAAMKSEGWKLYPARAALAAVQNNLAQQAAAAAGWDVGTPQQQARFAEISERRAAVANEFEVMNARIDEIVAAMGAADINYDPATPPVKEPK